MQRQWCTIYGGGGESAQKSMIRDETHQKLYQFDVADSRCRARSVERVLKILRAKASAAQSKRERFTDGKRR